MSFPALGSPRLIVVAAWVVAIGCTSVRSPCTTHAAPPPAATQPNIVLILTDDLGYADLGCFGSPTIRTPRIDALATQGTRLTQFYVAQAVCSASRAALMTGCYANRVGLAGALNHTSPAGIHPDELLIPEMLQAVGYATGIFGKWHLGLSPAFSPLKNGFDEYFGIPYSNDNTKYHPTLAEIMPPLPLYDGDTIVETDPDQSLLTRRLTERAVDFIDRHRDRPFFLYVPHVMPHVPIFASDTFRNRSPHGLYADVIEEIDWSVGQVVDAVEAAGLSENTLIIFTSDNGPFLSYGEHAGKATPLREGKLTVFEGGVRVPTVMRWPGIIPAGRDCDEPLMSIDLLPTFAAWTGGELGGLPIDGRDIGEVLRGVAGAKSPHESLLFYSGDELHAVRSGPWKLHLPHPYLSVIDGEVRSDGKPAGYGRLKPKSITLSGVEGIASRHGYQIEHQPQALYHLGDDSGESRDLSAQHPEVTEKLLAIAARARQTLGDGLTNTRGSEVRRSGHHESAGR